MKKILKSILTFAIDTAILFAGLILLVYLLLLMLLDKIFGLNYFILIVATIIYILLVYKKILVFSSSWIDDK